MNESAKQDWISTAITVDHGFGVTELGDLERLLLDRLQQTPFKAEEIIEQTHAQHRLSVSERQSRLSECDCLSFAVRGQVNCQGVVGLRSLQLSLTDSRFAWVSRASLGPGPADLMPLIYAAMACCSSVIALVAPADRLRASVIAELVCEGLSVDDVVQRIHRALDLDVQGELEMKDYFRQHPQDRLENADTYFRLRF